MLASRIDTHGNHDPVLSAKAQPVFCIQYNVQTLKDVGDETDMFARFRIENAAIICIQENRKSYCGIKDMYGYFKYFAAVSQGVMELKCVFRKLCHLLLMEADAS